MASYVSNAFSLSMVQDGLFSVTTLSKADATAFLASDDVISFVGHADTSSLIGEDLGVSVPTNRGNLSLLKGDELLVAQYQGPRLPEGTKVLPEGASFRYILVRPL